ncbi:glycosyltransferase involved in cell wall biosynthesis [Geomicrobium halophilum]|uniref:Glycosyltransferase involved in cell wall biosynthesis n=1 Tax=Geomicrobium halophilum TaxID=549000 RepID=A0A841PYZ2_9BACL|nr:glycosyltransferase [Geomicrobium halophilum]MBB6450003.1 glycosyltransferase involved in cell wall biosynthesis [Geomicrobium halophilum]
MTRKKKVCMLVHTHSFLDSRIFQKEAKSLQQNGYDVTMIVPRMKGKLFSVNKKPFNHQFLQRRFVHEGVKIVTYHYEQFKPTVSYMQSKVRSSEMIFNNPVTKLGLAEDADVYHAHEITSLFFGIGIKRALANQGKKTKLIFDSHDLIPDPFDQNPKFVEMGKLLDDMLEEIDQMITVSPSIKAWYITKKPTLPIEIIYNSPPLNRSYKRKPPKANALTVGYEGHVSKQKKGSSDKIFDITKESKRTIENFKFKIIGGVLHGHTLPIPNSLRQNITLSGWVDFHDISKQMVDVDIGWIDFDDLNHSLNRSYALPNKFFSYLNNGIPVIVNKCHDMEQFIRTHHCGIVLNKTKATGKDYAQAILYLHENRDVLQKMRANARRVMEELYNWEKMEDRLLRVYDSLLNKPKIFYIE